jgi:hypothetical protein
LRYAPSKEIQLETYYRMKLAHYQIEQIKEYIDQQNIWYDDIKDELLDHIICAVEADMEANESKFVDALGKALTEVSPNELQRQKLKVEHVQAFKDVFTTFKQLVSGPKILYVVLLLLLNISITQVRTIDLNEFLKLLHLCGLVLLFLNFIIRTLNNHKFRPLYNVYFMSRLNAIYTSSLISTSIISLLLSNWLVQTPTALVAYSTLFMTYLIASFIVLNRTFLKVKEHAEAQ